RKHGFCDLYVDQIAALAGVSRSTVRDAIREAHINCDLRRQERRIPGQKSRTNIIRIISREWLTWLSHGPAGSGVGVKTSAPYKISPPRKFFFSSNWRGGPVEKWHGKQLEYG